MKYLSIILCCLFIAANASSQTTNPADFPYKKDPKIPAFKILQSDSTWFAKDQLPKNYDYTVIIYFAPDCGHCQYTTGELVKKMDSLKNVSFVFVASAHKKLSELKEFYDHYKLAPYPNIRMGRDPEYQLLSFYHIESTPFVAIYDKKGMFVKSFDPRYGPVMEAGQLVELVNKK